jgi:hypothetical protein
LFPFIRKLHFEFLINALLKDLSVVNCKFIKIYYVA